MNPFRFRERELWILVGSGLLLFYEALLFGQTVFFRDLHLHFFPQKLRFVELIRSGELPLWDPFLHGGQPFLADLNNMALYPFNLFYLILPAVFAFNFDIIFHVLLSAAGAYWLARFLGVSPVSSIVAGAVYAFCGYALSLINLMNRLSAMPYLPLMLLTLHAFLTDRRPRWFALCVVFGVLQILAGAPEMTLLTFVTLLGWLLFAGFKGRFLHKLSIYFALALLVAGISAIQIVPTVEMVGQSLRSSHSDFDSFSAWSLHQKRIPEMIFPGFLGFTNRVSNKDYWGSNFESMGFPFILSIYFGWLTLSFAFFGALSKTDTQRLRLFLAAIAVIAIVVSMGRYLPGYRTLYEYVPFAAAVRYPIKFLAIGLLPLSLLAAFGLDRILVPEGGKKRISIYFWLSVVLFGAWALMFRFSKETANSFLLSYFGQANETAVEALRSSFAHTALVSAGVACLYQYWILKPAGIQHSALAAILLFDLIRSGFDVNHYAPREFLTQEPELVKTVRAEIGAGRFYRSPNPPNLVLKLPANDVVYFGRWHLETLHNYAGALYSVPILYHEDFDNLAQKEIVALSDYLLHASWEERLPFLTIGAVSIFVTSDQLSLPHVQLLSTIRNSSTKNFYLYRNHAFSGIAFFARHAAYVTTQEEALRRMKNPDFDPRMEMIVLQPERSDRANNTLEPCEDSQVSITSVRAMRLEFHARSNCDAYIYFAQPFYNGWITLVDGIEAPTQRANYAFSATFVQAGEHKIERIYKPRSVRIGMTVTIVSMILLIIAYRKIL